MKDDLFQTGMRCVPIENGVYECLKFDTTPPLVVIGLVLVPIIFALIVGIVIYRYN